MSNLILASSSPRRKELLQKLSIPFTTYSPDVDEKVSKDLLPNEIVKTLALRKALHVAQKFPEAYTIGSDTIVVCKGNVLGKPQNREEASQMLHQLSNCTHSVYTGVAIVSANAMKIFYERTDVEFWELSAALINQYLDSGEPFDKAGAYGIQGRGALLVKSISGDYYSVVGLPISRLSRVLSEMGLPLL
ncbi:Maf family protein [Lederbergia lenta]|uniref:dTTP/UTP pyrophosphatase n=1 Tax=Lederbergia lenta TaxID=1467 RepID=A0A2X4YVH7_LEDLE|nr:Maf family protein [Lederbergia lenta]MCM3111270.1 Maf family protein [Lederbergia lenta]MEC2325342.1 Maf family protein [Lederbergia lenta]SQI55795.1 Maf-like protein [Lederbergia lenta]